ncbi:MAG: 2-C-methyl-D-erythritol 4-phosphate cytidylyltransferase [Bacteroidales bacterium]
MKQGVLVVAAGRGQRMGSETPKQFLELKGKPLLVHSLERFRDFDPGIRMVVVLGNGMEPFWEPVLKAHPWLHEVTLATGGTERSNSVRNGLAVMSGVEVVGIHDAVRPLVSRDTLERTYAHAAQHGSAIPAVDMEDSVRRLTGRGSEAVDRSTLKRIQTPQVFQLHRIREAYDFVGEQVFTDDAAVYEACYGSVDLVKGNRENLKITTPADLRLAEALLDLGH